MPFRTQDLSRRHALILTAYAPFGASLARADNGITITPRGTVMDGMPIADCASIDQIVGRLKDEAGRSDTMSQKDADSEVQSVLAALNKRAAVKNKAKEAAGKSSKDLALAACAAAVDLVVAACIAKQDFVCIASAHGVKLAGGAAVSAVQLMNAKTPTEQAEVGIAFVKDRGTIFVTLIGDLKPMPLHDAARTALERIAQVAQAVSEAGDNFAAAKTALNNATTALDALATAYEPALISEKKFREFRKRHFEAQLWFLGVLKSGYADCRISGSLPVPTP